jgi:hypothetical protein
MTLSSLEVWAVCMAVCTPITLGVGWLDARSAGAKPLTKTDWKRLGSEAARLARDAVGREYRDWRDGDNSRNALIVATMILTPAHVLRTGAHMLGAMVAGDGWTALQDDVAHVAPPLNSSPAGRRAGHLFCAALVLALVHAGVASYRTGDAMTSLAGASYWRLQVAWIALDPVVGLASFANSLRHTNP